MSELRFKFLVCYLIAVIAGYLLKKVTYRIATKAINDKKLSTGLYKFFPVEGDKAVELAKGHIRGLILLFGSSFYFSHLSLFWVFSKAQFELLIEPVIMSEIRERKGTLMLKLRGGHISCESHGPYLYLLRCA